MPADAAAAILITINTIIRLVAAEAVLTFAVEAEAMEVGSTTEQVEGIFAIYNVLTASNIYMGGSTAAAAAYEAARILVAMDEALASA
jgi:hypothetical protein